MGMFVTMGMTVFNSADSLKRVTEISFKNKIFLLFFISIFVDISNDIKLFSSSNTVQCTHKWIGKTTAR